MEVSRFFFGVVFSGLIGVAVLLLSINVIHYISLPLIITLIYLRSITHLIPLVVPYLIFLLFVDYVVDLANVHEQSIEDIVVLEPMGATFVRRDDKLPSEANQPE